MEPVSTERLRRALTRVAERVVEHTEIHGSSPIQPVFDRLEAEYMARLEAEKAANRARTFLGDHANV